VSTRPRRLSLGLRGRIVGALLVTTVATLGIAAVALLGPLEQQLRNSALATLQREVSQATPGFQRLNLGASQTSPAAQRRLQIQANALAVRIGAPNVSVFAYPLVQLTFYDAESERGDTFDDVAQAFRNLASGKKGKAAVVPSFGTVEGTDVARVAMPITLPGLGGQTYVLAVRKTIEEIPGAVKVVRTAFITAALAGVALTLILGIPLAATLVRRLRRLRDAALGLARGGRSVEVPVDRARDEVGDLTRTFATMQRRLQHQEDARRAFVATASHELRTPLTSLDGMLELLDDDLRSGSPDIEDAIGLLERARAQSRRLGRLAADLLDLSRLDADVELRSEPIELGELSRAVLAEFELGTSDRGITSRLEGTAGACWALGDPGSIAQILRILLDNAVRATPPGSEIRVEMHDGTGPVTLSVCDEGPGVPEGERELIFQRFQRGRATGSRGGFGLGLAIGRELAERMGGELLLEDRPGLGATFTLRLPAARAPDEDRVPAV
jgi:signal transduction histidine kinase